MDLDAVLQEIDKNNPEMRIQNLETKVTDLEKKKFLKDLLPKVNLSIDKDFVEDSEDEKNEWHMEEGLGPQSIGVEIPIYTGGELRAYYNKAKISHEISKKQLNLVKYQIEEEAIKKYFQILNLRKQKEIAQMVIDNLNKQGERLEKLFNNGMLVPKSEVLKVKSNIISNEVIKMRRAEEQRSAEEELLLLLGKSVESQIELDEYLYDDINIDIYNPEKDSQIAIESGSAAIKEELLVDRSKADLKISKSEYLPKIYLDSEYRLKKDDDEYSDYQVSLVADWEIFNWGRTGDDVLQKSTVLEQAEILRDRNLEEIKLNIRNKYRDIKTLYAEVDSQKTKLDLEKENMRIDNLRYVNGMVSSLDYLDSVNRLKSAEEEYYSLQRELVLAVREYENLLK
ncbi:outer membrane efflux protein [Ilyobacter polytropus DSM 2926]|uniref:Outer membrane efflux protein n=2 Tax=Ilyobacter TaxID=167639 RepID=E3HB20_ILYPC|nr:outer membrane efflux protein [Ilyobacter polytropus DSM 2926]